jgi:predicted type IV restriction endonuclease
MGLFDGLNERFNRKSKTNRTKRIGKQFTAQIGRLSSILSRGKRNEEETRRWCVDVLKSGMGYSNDEITTELSVLGQRVDIAIVLDGKVEMVIECKAVTLSINQAAVNQAAKYAVSLGADWAVVTNGNEWHLYHVAPTRGGEPELTPLFLIELLDDDGVSTDDMEMLCLLTKEALLGQETRRYYHAQNSISFERICDALQDKEVAAVLARCLKEGYRRKMGIDVDIDDDDLQVNINTVFYQAFPEWFTVEKK